MINEIELFKEPLSIEEKLTGHYGREMSDWQSGFLCGLIKQSRPEKLVEVGVAAGGTTAVILNCIVMLGLDTKVYSVDLNEYFYADSNLKTGHRAQECKKYLQKDVDHKMYLGKILPECLEEIGDGIDFLVLDTVHRMPGEILDFLACLSKLRDGAVVVLHDIILNQLGECIPEYFVTKELLSTVVGEKIVGKEEGSPYEYPNIGAFRVTKDTRKYAENLFLALTISWGYMPDSNQLELYRQCFVKDYEKELCEQFEKAISLNRDSLAKRSGSVVSEVDLSMELKQMLADMNEFAEKVRGKKNVWVYGGGITEKRCTLC